METSLLQPQQVDETTPDPLAALPSWDSLTWRDKLAFVNGWLLVSGLACIFCIIGSCVSLAQDVNYVPTDPSHQMVRHSCLVVLE